MQTRSRIASQPKRKIQILNNYNALTGNFMALGMPETNTARFSNFIKNTKRNSQDQKASRLPRNELLDILFKCFDDYDYYSMKTLKEITKQPETYLKEVLESIAVLLKKGPYIMKWTLKTEFKNKNHMAINEIKQSNPNKSTSTLHNAYLTHEGISNNGGADNNDEMMQNSL